MGRNVRAYLLILLSILLTNEFNAEEVFGKFSLNVTRIDSCKGPKKKDCAIWSAKIDKGKIIEYNVTAFEDIKPLKGKIVILSNGKSLVRLQVNKVCEHVFMKPLFKTIFNITEDCKILKGNYLFNIDTEDLLQKYYGGDFFYGNVIFKSILNNNECNFTCSSLGVLIYPKEL